MIQLAEIIYDKGSRTLYLVCELMDMNIYELIKDRTHYINDHKVKHYMYQLLQVRPICALADIGKKTLYSEKKNKAV